MSQESPDRNHGRDEDDLFDGPARRLLRRNGIDIGDVVAVVIKGGPTINGRLVAAFDRVIRVVTNGTALGGVTGTVLGGVAGTVPGGAAGAIPAGTLLTINVDDIAAIGRVNA